MQHIAIHVKNSQQIPQQRLPGVWPLRRRVSETWANVLDANKCLSKHEHSEMHKICCAKWNDLKKTKAGKQKDIMTRINPDRDEVAGRNGISQLVI